MNTTVKTKEAGTVVTLRAARALTYLLYAFVVATLVILSLGFILELFGANPDAGFAQWVYRSLTRVMAPFRGLFDSMQLNGKSILDLALLFAMIVYGLVAMCLHALINWLTDRLVEEGYGRTP
jgi:uncharacterized protein YggT (Ycf19 family)